MSDNKGNASADSMIEEMIEKMIEKMIELFNDHSGDFGFDEEECLESQCDFEDKFLRLICEYKGHDVGPDECRIPEHDLCYRCRKLLIDINLDDERISGDKTT